jgi:heme exporter protein B
MWKATATILWKDLRIELRTREAISGAFVFCVLTLVIFNFALDFNTAEARRLAAGFFWVAFAFGSVLALNRSFAIEKESDCVRALMLAPIDRWSIFAGKFLANVIFMFLIEMFVLPLFVIFFDVTITIGALGLLVLIFVLGAIGFASVGTLFSAVAANTRMRELLLPVLLLPVTVPLLIAAVETTSYALGADIEASLWFKLLIGYDVIFVTACFMLFEFVMEE